MSPSLAKLNLCVICAVLAPVCAMAGCAGHADQVIAQTRVGPSIQYLDSWGVKGDDPGQLLDPAGIAVDTMGDVFVTNLGNGYVNKFERAGTPLLSFQEDGLKRPQSIFVDDGGAMYVADAVRNSVYIFLPNGDKYKELHLKSRASAENRLSAAVGNDGLVHVLDSDAGDVVTFTPRTKVVSTWRPSGAGANVTRYGPMVHAPDDSLYLGDNAGTVLKFTADGHFVSEIAPASAPAGSGVNALWKTSAGFALWSNHLFVMDPDGRMLHVATLDGKHVIDADLAPQLGQARRAPPMLAVTSQGELLVLDQLETRVLRYRIKL